MPKDTAFLDAFGEVEIELRDGSVFRAQPLSIRQFAHFWQLYRRSGGGDADAMMQFLDEFPEAIGRPEIEDEYTPGELFAMVPRFFTAARTGKLPKETPKPKEETEETESPERDPMMSGLMT